MQAQPEQGLEGPPAKRRKLPSTLYNSSGFEMHDRRLKDVLPATSRAILASQEPPISRLPPILPSASTSARPTVSVQPPLPALDNVADIPCPTRGVLDTVKNPFGVFRRYQADALPNHDPESIVNLETLSNIPKPASPTPSTSDEAHPPSFYPYPNESSFLLGDWFWNGGVQKSHDSFKKLLAIVGNPKFSSEDVGSTNWDRVNAELGLNDWDAGDWVDEDAGWHMSPVTFQVPFPKSTRNPGPRSYTIPNFYYRSLTSVIREKLGNSLQDPHFHYEPFELLWKPAGREEPVRLHGELYSSPAFIEAHNKLQNSPGVPGCDLQRVVVGLMFWSDATHLTSFGKTKLWPLYLFFGNDSKYRRCKPSENLCEHVAYFEAVRLFGAALSNAHLNYHSFPMRSKTLLVSILGS